MEYRSMRNPSITPTRVSFIILEQEEKCKSLSRFCAELLLFLVTWKFKKNVFSVFRFFFPENVVQSFFGKFLREIKSVFIRKGRWNWVS